MIYINNQTVYRLPRQTIQRVLRSAANYLKLKNPELSVVFVTPQQIKKLNQQYRGKNQPTDVLSFSYEFDKSKKRLEGEIVICYSLAAKQAAQYGHSVKQEIIKLLIHSLLHLIGYDHQTDYQARRMEKMETKIIDYIKTKTI